MNSDILISKLSNKQKAQLVSGVDSWYTAEINNPKIPEIMMADGPAGLRKQQRMTEMQSFNESQHSTSFPSAAMVASTFNSDLVYKFGSQMGKIALDNGVNLLLGPGVNLKRSPLVGRNFEYYSEDPIVAGTLGTSFVKGLQGQGVGATVKHFVANNRENQRFTNSSDMDMRTLRELYLKPFEMIIKDANPMAIMASYNKLNGTQVVENSWLLKEVLRNEWHFDGLVMSDWYAVGNSIKSLKAGIDLEMPGNQGASNEKIERALDNGEIAEEEIDVALHHILKVVSALNENDKIGHHLTSPAEDHAMALEIAEEGVVLLKNNLNLLPLKANKKILLVGPFAEKPRYQGGGSSHVNAIDVTNLKEALLEKQFDVKYQRGFNVDSDLIDPELEKELVEHLTVNQKIVLCLGFRDQDETEGFDKQTIKLPDNQLHILNLLSSKVGKENLVVVLSNGSVIDTSWKNKANAILEGYLGGEAGGQAVANILTGEVNPSGKLAETVPLHIEDTPMITTFNKSEKHEAYHEGVFMGYRYYDTSNKEVSFPFGHGLSYTTFSYHNLEVNQIDKSIRIRVSVKNIGKVPGKEVVQLYVGNHATDAEMPLHELKRFDKIQLEPNEEKVITFDLQAGDFQWFNEDISNWQTDNGEYSIEIGASSRDIRLQKTVVIDCFSENKRLISLETNLIDVVDNKEQLKVFKEVLAPALPDALSDMILSNPEPGTDAEMDRQQMLKFPLKSLVAMGIDETAIYNFINAF